MKCLQVKTNYLNMFRMGWGKAPFTPFQFFPCNFYKSRNQPSKLFDIYFWPFCNTAVKLKGSACLRLLNLNQDRSPKEWIFWSNSLKNNFPHVNARVAKFWSNDHSQLIELYWWRHKPFLKIPLFLDGLE